MRYVVRYTVTGPTDFSAIVGDWPAPNVWDASTEMVSTVDVNRPVTMADAVEVAGLLAAQHDGKTVVVESIEPVVA